MTLSQIGVIPHVYVKGTSAYEWEREIVQSALCPTRTKECTCILQYAVLQYLICKGLHPHGALHVNLPGHRADLKMLSAHNYKHSHPCNYVSLITDKLSTTALYLEPQCLCLRLMGVRANVITCVNVDSGLLYMYTDTYLQIALRVMSLWQTGCTVIYDRKWNSIKRYKIFTMYRGILQFKSIHEKNVISG